MEIAQNKFYSIIEATIIKADGTRIPLGVLCNLEDQENEEDFSEEEQEEDFSEEKEE